ncbi:MAG TPA: hypothetical protein VFE47_18710 [Tepidisphaeraceae bacterium]|nr:hypothetical protein [Tepidisphaeraceae bacterium]
MRKPRIFILSDLLALAFALQIRHGLFFTRESASVDLLMLSGLCCGIAFLLRAIPPGQKPAFAAALWKLRWIVPGLGLVLAAAGALLQMRDARPAYLIDLAAAGFNLYCMPIAEVVQRRLQKRRLEGTPGEWRTFTSLLGRYSVEMPGVPGETSATESLEDASTVQHTAVLALPSGVVFQISWFDVPELVGAGDGEVEFYFRELLSEMATENRVMSGVRRLDLRGFPGCAYEETPSEPTAGSTVHVRLYLAHARSYAVLAEYKTGAAEHRQAIERFHGSFSFI